MKIMIPLDEALEIISEVITPLTESEACPLEHALGRVTASDITAPYALPRFTNTGVDGYAYAFEEGRTHYDLVGTSYAGEPYEGTLEHGQAVRIATGAVLPDGADTVAMQEVCKVQDDLLYISELPEKGANLRPAGGDITEGDVVMAAGTTFRVQDVALLGALGVREVTTLRKLKIAIASTGAELAEDTEHSGQIIDTNTLMLAQMLESSAVNITRLPPLPDDAMATRTVLQNASEKYDLIITTGGVSVGDRDYVRDIVHEQGKVHFWKTAIRPGKPVLCAGLGKSLFIGLPGNPVSAFVTAHLYVRAALRAFNGQDVTLPPGFPVTLGEDVSKPAHLRCFFRAYYDGDKVRLYSGQASNMYTSLTKASGLLDLPFGITSLKKSDRVTYRPFELFI